MVAGDPRLMRNAWRLACLSECRRAGTVVKRMLLGNVVGGTINSAEASALFRRLDGDGDGVVDYRELAANLSAPGWDSRFIGHRSNILL
mmetsp:Transcript_46489/g.123408  ORF Transcript_46489/g.123408 Transcript_46489/m.123408 type:complete len:89 (-) Transcript_46489:278-544(-)